MPKPGKLRLLGLLVTPNHCIFKIQTILIMENNKSQSNIKKTKPAYKGAKKTKPTSKAALYSLSAESPFKIHQQEIRYANK